MSSRVDSAVTFREMTAEDIPAGLALCRASGWNQVERDWRRFLETQPGGAIVAERDSRVIGTVATMRYGRRFAWVAMVLVDPAERSRGAGRALLTRGLSLLDDVETVRLDDRRLPASRSTRRSGSSRKRAFRGFSSRRARRGWRSRQIPRSAKLR